MTSGLPIIDMGPLLVAEDLAGRRRVAGKIARACRAHGFFYLTGHGIGREVLSELEAESRRFFALPEASRMAISMDRGGRAWRGYFPVGGELTSGRPDLKEGLYLGTELGPDHPRVQAGVPMHGANLWPAELPGLRDAATAYMGAATRAAAALMEGVSESLGLEPGLFRPALHQRADGAVPHLPLSCDGTERRKGRLEPVLGCRRAHRLWPAHPDGPGPVGRPAG